MGLIGRIKRRQLLRLGFLAGTLLATAELSAVFVPFFRVNKIVGLGAKVPVGSKDSILSQFKSSNDAPILNIEGKFFLLHAPGGIAAAYRKCTHLGCTVPWNAGEDQFHCPCHGSLYDKHTAVVKGGPAPRPALPQSHRSRSGNPEVGTTTGWFEGRHDGMLEGYAG